MESAHEENCADEFPNPVQLTAINFIVGEYASSTDEMKLIAVNMSANKPSNKLEILLNIELDMNAPCSMGNNTMPIFEYILTFYSAHITADIFRAFIDAGADVNARNCFGAPILHGVLRTMHIL